MSLPDVVHPWSLPAPIFTLTTLTDEVAVTEPAPECAAAAAALFAAGFAESARALATLGGSDELTELVALWRERAASDAVLARTIMRSGEVLVPSVQVTADGAPRFVLLIPDPAAVADAIAQEFGEHGVQAELRLFLDEVLRTGDRFVDAAPGVGFAAMTAASADAVASVIALCDTAAQCAAIDASARCSDVSESVTAREGVTLAELALGPAIDGASTILHAGGASAVAPLLTTARAALERGDIGAVAWRCGRADETGRDAECLQIAAAVLGVFGFEHFALVAGVNGPELVPADAMSSNEMIFSIEPGFMARFGA
jgi:hypothetical protein